MTQSGGTPSRADLLGAALVITSAVAFSAKAIFVKLAYGDLVNVVRVDPVTLLAMRMGLALPLFALIAWRSSKDAEYSINDPAASRGVFQNSASWLPCGSAAFPNDLQRIV